MASDLPVEAIASPVYASWGARFAAWLLDGIIVLGSLWGAATAVAFAMEDAASGIAAFFLLGLLAPLYYAFFHAGKQGQTIGKRALRIAVRNAKTLERISLWRALARAYIVAVFWATSWSFIPIVLDSLWPLWDKEHQTWHDKVGASVVVRV